MGLKVIDTFDTSFKLSAEAAELLQAQLQAAAFGQRVSAEKGWREARFTGQLFKPVPYSRQTPKGMAAEFERYHEDGEHYAIVHVPPPMMFEAKVFQPNRLCAIFERVA